MAGAAGTTTGMDGAGTAGGGAGREESQVESDDGR